MVSDTLIDDEQYQTLSISFDERFDREGLKQWLGNERWNPGLVIEIEPVWKVHLKH